MFVGANVLIDLSVYVISLISLYKKPNKLIETSNCVIFTIEVFFFTKKRTKTDLSFNLSGQYVLSGGEEDEWQWSEHRSSLACVLQSTLSLSFGAAIKRHLSFEQRRSDNLSLSLSLSLSHVNEINMWSLFFE